MTNYIFLTENYNEGPTTYYAISSDKIETLNLCDTYDRNGQKVGHFYAGDYHLDNHESDATKDCIKAVSEKFSIDEDNIHLVNTGGEIEIEAGDGAQYGFDEKTVEAFIKEWREKNESLTEVKGFDYWDGHNWKTITTGVYFGEPSHEIVSDEKLVAELNEAIENKSFEKSGFGCEVYSHDKWVVIDSNWQGTWAAFEIMSMEDYEHMQPNSSALPALH
jgi:hypothetical protein